MPSCHLGPHTRGNMCEGKVTVLPGNVVEFSTLDNSLLFSIKCSFLEREKKNEPLKKGLRWSSIHLSRLSACKRLLMPLQP